MIHPIDINHRGRTNSNGNLVTALIERATRVGIQRSTRIPLSEHVASCNAASVRVGFLNEHSARSLLSQARSFANPYRPRHGDRLMSNELFTVDGTLIEAWASLKSFKKKDAVEDLRSGTRPSKDAG